VAPISWCTIEDYPHMEFDTYFVHQFDNGKNVNSLDAMGLVLKFYFKHKEIKKKSSKKDEE
jgi:hypothetical protein